MDYDLFVMNILWYYKYLQDVAVGVSCCRYRYVQNSSVCDTAIHHSCTTASAASVNGNTADR